MIYFLVNLNYGSNLHFIHNNVKAIIGGKPKDSQSPEIMINSYINHLLINQNVASSSICIQ